MDIIEIKNLLNSPKVIEINTLNLSNSVMADLLKAYTLMGQAKDIEQLKEDITIIGNELVKDLLKESKFKNLRVLEISYAFGKGIKGELKVKTYGLNYQTFYYWLDSYVYSEERVDALNSYIQDSKTLLLEAKTEPTEGEKEKMIIEHINQSYADYINNTPAYIDLGTNIVDWGNVKANYLTQKNIKPRGMSLEEFYSNCRKQGKTKLL